MPVDQKLVDEIVAQILGKLGGSRETENVLIIGSRSRNDDLNLPIEDTMSRQLFFSDEPHTGVRIDRYILPLLKMCDMADLAVGKTGTPTTDQILPLLLAGKKVEVLEYEYSGYENTAPPQLFQLYCDYAQTLKGFGLRQLQKVQKISRLNKRVISEKDIEDCHAKGVRSIRIADSALVTSLAAECAKKLGIEIQQNERGA